MQNNLHSTTVMKKILESGMFLEIKKTNHCPYLGCGGKFDCLTFLLTHSESVHGSYRARICVILFANDASK